MKTYKADLIVWIANLPEDSLELKQIQAIRNGESGAEIQDCGRCLTISEAAKRAGIGRPTLYRAIQSGALIAAPLYPNGRPRIRESDYLKWITTRGSRK